MMSETTTEVRRLGASGIEVSSMGVGAWAWGDKGVWGFGKEYGQKDVEDAFAASLDNGLNFFDTAEIYGSGTSERIVGACVRSTKAHAIIASKFAPLPPRLRPASLITALDASLERLGLQTLDLYQIHWPYTLLDIDSLMDEMALAVKSGKIRAVGVSNYSADQMRRAQRRLARYGIPLASNQVNYSLLKRTPEANGVLATCQELDVALIAYSPLAQGALTGKYTGANATKVSGPRGLFKNFRNKGAAIQPVIDALNEVGRAHDKTPAQVALNWLLRRDDHIIPIPGAKNTKQATQNAGALGWRMDDAEFARIDRATQNWRK